MPLTIDPSFIDVDFTKDPLFTHGDNTPTGELFAGFNEFEADEEPLPEDQWEAMAEVLDQQGGGNEWFIEWILNQLREGSCVGQAGTQLLQIIGAKQFGLDRMLPLSAISLYDRIGSSAQSGAMVSDAMTEVTKRGVVPLNTDENKLLYPVTMPATGFSRTMPAGWEPVAANFKADECLVIRSVPKIVTAGLKGHPICVGRSGHSICYLRPKYRNGKLGFLYVNSWGSWGFGAGKHKTGFGWDSLSMIQASARWAFAVRTMTVPSVLRKAAA